MAWYIIGTLVESIRTNVQACLFQTFAAFYGLVSTYSLILLICLERYVVVKSMNFVIGQTLDRFKYLAIGGTLALGFMFTLETILFTRSKRTISTCSVPNLYGDQYSFFVFLMVGALTGIMILIIAVSVRTSYNIWKMFFRKNKIDSYDMDISTRIDSKQATQNQQTPLKSEKTNKHHVIRKTNDRLIEDDNKLTNSSEESTPSQNFDSIPRIEPLSTGHQSTHSTSRISHISAPRDLSYKRTTNTNVDASIITEKSDNLTAQLERRKSNIQQLIKHLKNERISDTKSMIKCTAVRNSKQKSFKFNAWEFRAFTNSIIIAVTTFLFTGPFLVSYWIYINTGTLLPQQKRFWLFLPLVMNSILNPFIYAWRIPEIRKQFRKLLTL